jgi:hypothetical protein
LEYCDGGPEEIVEVFPVTFAPFVIGDDHLACALFNASILGSIVAKLTAKKVHPQYAEKQ